MRILVKVSALYATGRRSDARVTVARSLREGTLSSPSFCELLIHLSLFLGYPAMLEGLEHLSNLGFNRTRSPLREAGANAHMQGRRILERIYGDQTLKLLRHLDSIYPGLGRRIIQDAYGHIMTRSGLSLAEREVVNVVVLFAQGFDRQLYSHLRGAIRVGVRRDTLESVIVLTAAIAKKRSRRALSLLEKADPQ